MKKSTFIVGIAAVFAAILVGLVWFLPSDDESSRVPSRQAASAQRVSPACRLFALEDAVVILGSDAKLVPGTNAMDAVSDISDISACRYVTGVNADAKYATVLVRLARTTKGADYNKSMFGEQRPAGKQTVSGVGDVAFWDETLLQLNILKGDTWYVIDTMNGAQAGGTLDASREIYDQIKSKL